MNRNISPRRSNRVCVFGAYAASHIGAYTRLSRACTQPMLRNSVVHNTCPSTRLPVVDIRLGRWQRDNSHLPNLWRYRATTGVNDPFENRRGCPRNWSRPERHVAAKKHHGGCTPRMGYIREYAVRRVRRNK